MNLLNVLMMNFKNRRTKTSKMFFLLLTTISIIACDDEGKSAPYQAIVVEDENNVNKLSQLTFTLSLYDPEKGYVLTNQIDSLTLCSNGKYWGSFSSEVVDTTLKTDRLINGIQYSTMPVEYLFIAPYQLTTDGLETAGDVIDYLNQRIVLTPGEYICELSNLKYKSNTEEWVTNNINVFEPFSVLENVSSCYLGKIIITVE